VPTLNEVRLNRAEQRLDLTFDDASRYSLPAEYLRVESPSAEVQGHGPQERKIIPGCRHVGISAIEPVGNYAIRILFDDGHDTGIFSWDYLHTLGQQQDRRWAAYLDALASKGLSRDRR
jgi:DUF971 family protein